MKLSDSRKIKKIVLICMVNSLKINSEAFETKVKYYIKKERKRINDEKIIQVSKTIITNFFKHIDNEKEIAGNVILIFMLENLEYLYDMTNKKNKKKQIKNIYQLIEPKISNKTQEDIRAGKLLHNKLIKFIG